MGGSFVGREQDATKGVYAQAGTCKPLNPSNRDTLFLYPIFCTIQLLKTEHFFLSQGCLD